MTQYKDLKGLPHHLLSEFLAYKEENAFVLSLEDMVSTKYLQMKWACG